VLENEHQLFSLTDRAYKHPNQFDKVVLVRSEDEGRWQLRLHIWRHQRQGHADIHNHRWDFASWVIAGRFRQECFKVVESGGAPMGLYSWSDGCDATLPVPFVDTVQVEPTTTNILARGDWYELKADVLHDLAALEPGLSMVLQGPTVRHHSDIIRSIDHAGSHLPHADHLSLAQVHNSLELALQLLDQN
jgi:hypothetical protein